MNFILFACGESMVMRFSESCISEMTFSCSPPSLPPPKETGQYIGPINRPNVLFKIEKQINIVLVMLGEKSKIGL